MEKNLKDQINKYIDFDQQIKTLQETIKEQLNEIKVKKNEMKATKEVIDNIMKDNNIQEFTVNDYTFKVIEKKQKPKISTDILNEAIEKEMTQNKIPEEKAKNIIKKANININKEAEEGEVDKKIIVKKKRVINKTNTKRKTKKNN